MYSRAALCAVWLCLALPVAAAECRLALVLGLDISSSVDPDEDALQRGGMARALTAPEVIGAFFALDVPVALAIFEWSGRYNQELLLNWTMIRHPTDLARAAQAIRQSRRSYAEFPTAMGEALKFAGQMISRGPKCWASTIDISGDGENNEGPTPADAYQDPVFDGVTVNGLVIANAADFQTPHRLTQFYLKEVLHGPNAFMVEADGFADYERALRLKLERELSLTVIGQRTENDR